MNAELVNNLGNLANRVLSCSRRARLESSSRSACEPKRSSTERARQGQGGSRGLRRLDYRAGVKLILEIGQPANMFLTKHEPWKTNEDR